INPTILLSINLLLWTGCYAEDLEPQAGDDVDVDVTSEPLNLTLATLWPQDRDIPVCWENPGSADALSRKWVSDAVSGSWQAASNLRFTGWGTCTQNASGIRIRISDEVPHTKASGRLLDGKPSGIVLNTKFQNWKQQCATERERCI